MKTNREILGFVIRALLTGLAAANGALIAALPGLASDDLLLALLLGVGSALGYAGIGVAVPHVEPLIRERVRAGWKWNGD